MAESTTGIENFFKTISNEIKDACELQVLTFSGNVRSYIKSTGDGIDWSSFFSNAANQAFGELVLVAASRVKIDGDTILFISSAPEAVGPLKQAHVDATLAAQKYRTELIMGLASIVGLKLPPV